MFIQSCYRGTEFKCIGVCYIRQKLTQFTILYVYCTHISAFLFKQSGEFGQLTAHLRYNKLWFVISDLVQPGNDVHYSFKICYKWVRYIEVLLYSGTSVYDLNPFQIPGPKTLYTKPIFPIRNKRKMNNPFP